ncbi:hypothetical protein E2986_10745 [Frieseomelitta varia]|uniref:Uncharacterized protein n=1 Tax=Frieseomelitta varia TaxID=561572 RepID=A0A833WAQ7_9HYME|nr:hypothetical protein E2986_10745 [Frieseomelitta varia]
MRSAILIETTMELEKGVVDKSARLEKRGVSSQVSRSFDAPSPLQASRRSRFALSALRFLKLDGDEETEELVSNASPQARCTLIARFRC